MGDFVFRIKRLHKKRSFVFVAFFIAAFLSFGQTLKIGFIWDDHQMIEKNPYIKNFSIENLKHNFSSNVFNQKGENYFRPFQTLTYMVDFALFKLNPTGWHFVNFFLHVLNAFLLFLILDRLKFSACLAFLTGIFFSTNSIVVEQMIIVAGRAEIMTFTFTLASVLFYLKGGTKNLLFSFIFFILSMLSKENGIITPLLIILALNFSGKRISAGKILPFVLAIPIYLFYRQCAVGKIVTGTTIMELARNALVKFPLLLTNYLYKTIIPFNLHSHNMVKCSDSFWGIFFSFIMALFVIWIFSNNRRILKFSILWYGICFLPKTLLLASQNLALDHWAYPSNVGIFIIIAFYIRELGKKKIVFSQFLALLLTTNWIVFSNVNISRRNTDLKIYENAAKYETSNMVYYNLAREYYLRKDYAASAKLLEQVLQKEKNTMFLNSYALVLLKIGEREKAKNILSEIIKSGRQTPETYLNLASVYVHAGNYADAEKTLLAGSKAFPKNQDIMLRLARIYKINKKSEKSYRLLKEIINRNPYNQEALLNLGIMEYKKGNLPASKKCFLRLEKINKSR